MRFVRPNPLMEAAGPILFGGLFLAPLIAQSLEAASLPAPFGREPIHFGLGSGVVLGIIAAVRGRWT